jgi:hypothetical protein
MLTTWKVVFVRVSLFHDCEFRNDIAAFMAGMLLPPPHEENDAEYKDDEYGETTHNTTGDCTSIVCGRGRYGDI